KAIFDNAEAITAAHAKGAELSIENATDGMTAPFHAGAAKYFAEKGVEVEVK
ncbi:MAG: C4-dicarboxylate ABC transporter substrate-binding protein, partial [Clostridia bacterium]|nr:C4-dicarboxylate ABC transporter substrate-binding protein [Clostridia bacterium]